MFLREGFWGGGGYFTPSRGSKRHSHHLIELRLSDLNLINNTVQVFFKENLTESFFSLTIFFFFADDISQTKLFSHFGFHTIFDQGDTFSERLVVPDNSFSTQIAMRGVSVVGLKRGGRGWGVLIYHSISCIPLVEQTSRVQSKLVTCQKIGTNFRILVSHYSNLYLAKSLALDQFMKNGLQGVRVSFRCMGLIRG